MKRISAMVLSMFLAGAAAAAAQTATGTSRTATTDSDGRYRIPTIEPGTYELRAALAGFRTAVRSEIIVTVGGSTEADALSPKP